MLERRRAGHLGEGAGGGGCSCARPWGQAFLGSLGQKAAPSALTQMWLHSDSMKPGPDLAILPTTQVIYKKFHVPCPLPLNFANVTGNFSLVEVTKEEASLQAETQTAALCTPSYFTLNSQVPTGQGGDAGPRESGVGCPDVVPVSPQTAYTIPIMAFAFVCHPEVLPIYTELKE